MLTNDNNVRRNDLSLRLKYIGIKTRIFKIAPFKYVILCSNIPDDFEKIKTYFDRSIRYLTLQISLSDQVPEHYIEELSPIDMEHPVDDFCATDSFFHAYSLNILFSDDLMFTPFIY